MIASEFTANAVRRSLSGAMGQTFAVRVHVYPGDYVWLEVEDQGGVWLPAEQDDHPHGLEIVRALVGAGNWSIEDTSDGCRVVSARFVTLDYALRQTGRDAADCLTYMHEIWTR